VRTKERLVVGTSDFRKSAHRVHTPVPVFCTNRTVDQRIKSRASCSVRRGGALRHSAQHIDLVSLIYIQACGGLRAGEPPGVSHCTEFAPNDQRILMCFRSLRTTTEAQP
jgi:hypothetical protein